MNAWIPKGSPFVERPLDQRTTSELNHCISYAEEHIEAEPDDSAERKRLQEWLRKLVAEKDDRVRVAAEMAERNRHLARGGRPDPGDPATLTRLPCQCPSPASCARCRRTCASG